MLQNDINQRSNLSKTGVTIFSSLILGTTGFLVANHHSVIAHADDTTSSSQTVQVQKHTSTIKPDNQAQKDQAMNDAQAAGVNVTKDNSTTYNANQVENDYNNSVCQLTPV